MDSDVAPRRPLAFNFLVQGGVRVMGLDWGLFIHGPF